MKITCSLRRFTLEWQSCASARNLKFIPSLILAESLLITEIGWLNGGRIRSRLKWLQDCQSETRHSLLRNCPMLLSSERKTGESRIVSTLRCSSYSRKMLRAGRRELKQALRVLTGSITFPLSRYFKAKLPIQKGFEMIVVGMLRLIFILGRIGQWSLRKSFSFGLKVKAGVTIFVEGHQKLE